MNTEKKRQTSLVTVLVTTYNEEEYIYSCIESVLNQSLKDVEVLVIDDGSTDNTVKILENEFDDERIQVESRTKIGRVNALNRGLKIASSEYVAILDADDICLDGRLKYQYKYLCRNEDVGIVGSYYVREDKIRNEKYIRKYPTDNRKIRKAMSVVIPVPHSTWMFRKSAVLDVGGYEPTEHGLEDMDLLIRVSQKWRLGNIPEPLTMRKIRDSSYWHSNVNDYIRNIRLSRLNCKAILRLELPYYLLAFTFLRLFYPLVPRSMKNIVRSISSYVQEDSEIPNTE